MMRAAIKFCGMTRVEDAWVAAELGAAAVGFVFWPKSSRAVTKETARLISRSLPPFIQRVGVFVDAPAAEVHAIADHAELDVVQLHGRESPQMAVSVWPRVIKSIGRGTTDLVVEADQWSDEITLLVDADDPAAPGGTGQRADWVGAAALARQRRIVLAGGLRPDNVAEAIRAVCPYAVDVASGVEDQPGRKNHRRMRAFVWAVESAWRQNEGDAGEN